MTRRFIGQYNAARGRADHQIDALLLKRSGKGGAQLFYILGILGNTGRLQKLAPMSTAGVNKMTFQQCA